MHDMNMFLQDYRMKWLCYWHDVCWDNWYAHEYKGKKHMVASKRKMYITSIHVNQQYVMLRGMENLWNKFVWNSCMRSGMEGGGCVAWFCCCNFSSCLLLILRMVIASCFPLCILMMACFVVWSWWLFEINN